MASDVRIVESGGTELMGFERAKDKGAAWQVTAGVKAVVETQRQIVRGVASANR